MENDVLIIDFETTSADPYTCNILQVGAVLVDKNSIVVKHHFSEIRLFSDKTWTHSAEKVHCISLQEAKSKDRKTLKQFKQDFLKDFALKDIRIASWNMFDFIIMKRLFQKELKKTYKFIELWSFMYPYLIQNNFECIRKKEFGLTSILNDLNIGRPSKHNALSDANYEAFLFMKALNFYRAQSSK